VILGFWSLFDQKSKITTVFGERSAEG